MYGEELPLEDFIDEYLNDTSKDKSVELRSIDSEKIEELDESDFAEIINERLD